MARSRRTRRACEGAAALVVVLVATLARAQDAPEPIDVDYDAPMVCPGRASFFAEVTARTARARAAAGGEKARVLHVRVERIGELHVGRLWIEDAGASSTAREVSGATCGEVVGALGLIAALAVDPRASVAPRPAPVAAAAAPPTPPAPTAAPPSSPGAAQAPPAAPPTSPGAVSSPGASREAKGEPAASTERGPGAREPARGGAPPSSSARSSRAPFGVGAAGELSSLAGAVVGVRVFFDAELGRGIFSPSLRVAATRTLAADRDAAIGSASFTWTTGSIDACPVHVDLATTLAVRPCASFAAGVLEAEPAGVANLQARTRPWASAGAHARLVWGPIRALAVELEGGAILPMTRESFSFAPSVAVYEAPVLAAVGRLGLSIRFP